MGGKTGGSEYVSRAIVVDSRRVGAAVLKGPLNDDGLSHEDWRRGTEAAMRRNMFLVAMRGRQEWKKGDASSRCEPKKASEP